MWNISISIALFIVVLGVLFFFEGLYRLTGKVNPTFMAWLWTIAGAILLFETILGYLQGHLV